MNTAVRSQSKRQYCLPRRPANTTTRPNTKLLRISHELSGADILVFRPLHLHPGPLGPSRHRLLFSSPATTYTTKHDAFARNLESLQCRTCQVEVQTYGFIHTCPHMYCISLEVVLNVTSFGTLNCRSICRVSLVRRTLSRGSGQTDQGRSCHAYYLFRYKKEMT
jgi:hypothetical protein